MDSHIFRFLFPVTGKLPLQLNCSFPGKWFTVKSVRKQDNSGGWRKVYAAIGTAEQLCKASRASAGADFHCTVSGSLPEISDDDKVKVEYYCWEIGKISIRFNGFSPIFLMLSCFWLVACFSSAVVPRLSQRACFGRSLSTTLSVHVIGLRLCTT